MTKYLDDVIAYLIKSLTIGFVLMTVANAGAQSCITPGTPAAPTISNVTTTTLTLSWSASSNANGYRVYYSLNFATYQFYDEFSSATPRNLSSLTPGGRYSFFIQAVRHCVDGEGFPDERTSGNSGASAVYMTPATPTLNEAACSSPDPNSITFAWGALACDGYYFDLSTSSVFSSYVWQNKVVTPSSTTSYNQGGLLPGTNYYYQLRAYNPTGGVSGYSPRSIAIPTRPVSPTFNAVTNITTSSFKVNWQSTPNGNATNYKLDVSTSPTFADFLPGYENLTVNGTSQDIVGLTTGIQYYYRVRSLTSKNTSANSSSSIKTISPAPALANADNILTTSFTANWNAATGADSYRLDVASDEAFSSMVPGYNNLVVNGTSKVINGLLAGTTYYYRIRTVNSGGTSINSGSKSQLTLPDSPGNFILTQNLATSISLDWDEVLSATEYNLEASTSQTFDILLDGYNPKVIAAFTAHVVEGLTPLTTYYFRIKTKNGSGVSSYSLNTGSTTNITGSGLVLSALQYPVSQIQGQSSGEISINAESEQGISTVDFYHRKKSETSFTKESVTDPSGDTYEITLDDSWFDAFGMEFYFVVKDMANQIKKEPATDGLAHTVLKGVSSVTLPIDGFGKDVKNYQIISFPYALSKAKIEEILVPIMGEYKKSSWRFLRYENGENKDYLEGLRISEVGQGKGYWFISKNEVDLSLGQGESYGNSASSPFTLPLKKGWNQIGNPFPYNLSWQTVIADNANPNVDNSFYVFDRETASFVESDLLKVFGGGFVFAENDTELTFRVTLPEEPAGKIRDNGKIKATDSSIENYLNWVLSIQLNQHEVTNTLSGIGMNAAALDSKDSYDKITPPRFIRYLEFNSRQSGFDYNLSKNIVSPKENHNWFFTIESNSSEDVELKWDSQIAAAQNAQLILYDQSKHVLIDMAKFDSYRTVSGADISIHFRKSNQMESDWLELGKPYPNPFRTELIIPFDFAIEESTQAELTIYDLNGRIQAQQMIKTEDNASGIQFVKWDVSHQQNEIEPGMYFYRIQVKHEKNIVNFNGKVIKQ